MGVDGDGLSVAVRAIAGRCGAIWRAVCARGARCGGRAAKIQTLPEQLRASLTCDQGAEMRDWKTVSVAAGIEIYFCDPHAPWQRATNENTNGLLRQYLPRGTDLSVHTAAELAAVAES